MKTLIACIVLSGCCFAQTATEKREYAVTSDIQTAGGFLDVCGRKGLQLSKGSLDAVAKAPDGEVLHTWEKGLAQTSADQSLCLGYLAGLIEGWREGHAHGVVAAHFSAGVPRDVPTALESLSIKEREAVGAAIINDVPCLPEQITVGELEEAILKHIRGQLDQNSFLRIAPTCAMVPRALREAFPCAPPKPAVPASR